MLVYCNGLYLSGLLHLVKSLKYDCGCAVDSEKQKPQWNTSDGWCLSKRKYYATASHGVIYLLIPFWTSMKMEINNSRLVIWPPDDMESILRNMSQVEPKSKIWKSLKFWPLFLLHIRPSTGMNFHFFFFFPVKLYEKRRGKCQSYPFIIPLSSGLHDHLPQIQHLHIFT